MSAGAPRRVAHHRLMPAVVVDLGELVGVIYRSAGPGRPRTYIHFMRRPPRLVTDIDGRQLYIVGGGYRVTRHGIEDRPVPATVRRRRRDAAAEART